MAFPVLYITLPRQVLTWAETSLISLKQITLPYSISNPEDKQCSITEISPPKIYLCANISLTYKIMSTCSMIYLWTYLSNSKKHWWWEAEKHKQRFNTKKGKKKNILILAPKSTTGYVDDWPVFQKSSRTATLIGVLVFYLCSKTQAASN